MRRLEGGEAEVGTLIYSVNEVAEGNLMGSPDEGFPVGVGWGRLRIFPM
jgi:hypothetical protein